MMLAYPTPRNPPKATFSVAATAMIYTAVEISMCKSAAIADAPPVYTATQTVVSAIVIAIDTIFLIFSP